MPLCIQITDQIVGQTWLYEGSKRTGRKCLVPTYRLVVTLDQVDMFFPDAYFAVTRDTSEVVFGSQAPHYGTNGECPPSRICHPYQGTWNVGGVLHDALRLYEPELGSSIVQGIGPVQRHGILIHHGPARSEGCFCIAGGRNGWKLFRSTILVYEAKARDSNIYVHVYPRHFGANNSLSSL